MGQGTADLVPIMLLLLLTMTVSGVICMFTVLYYLRHRRHAGMGPLRASTRQGTGLAVVPPFLYQRPTCWLAIRTRSQARVQKVLGLDDPNTCGWFEGLAGAAENRLFISPLVKGWILVFGSDLPRPSHDVDQCYRFLRGLSERLGEVHFYCGDPVTHEHGWARLVDGHVERGYAWWQETVWNEGGVTEDERKATLAIFDYGDAPEPTSLGAQERYRLNTDRLFTLAGRWSLDPSRVDRGDLGSIGQGVSGILSRTVLE